MEIFHSSLTAGQTNQRAPAPRGRAQPAIRGRALAFAVVNATAVLTEPNRGTGALAINEASDIVLEFFLSSGGYEGGRRTRETI
mmetsp:Transcript_2506/g.5825  ORF Transcript_2506/g.5825 Transcript_2506/m.5825 type:complete len:84 (+) Transcript_2506:600-851(+)